MDWNMLTQYLPLLINIGGDVLRWYGENKTAVDSIIALALVAVTYLVKGKAYRAFLLTAFKAAQEAAKLALHDEARRLEYEKQAYTATPPWVKAVVGEKAAIEIIENIYQTLTTIPIIVTDEVK